MKDKNEIKNRIDELRRLITKYDYNYYVLDSPLVEDYEYDNLYKELKALENDYPEFDSQDSPTKRVSEQNISGFEKFTHSPRMYSLDNTYNDNELESFHKRITNELHTGFSYSIEPKIDGAAISIIYRDSIFFRALTRGDGETGDDASENIRTIRDLPLMLKKNITGDIIVRGEVFFTKKRFERLSETYPFSNPRNAASGTLKLLNPKEASVRRLSVLIHTVVTPIAETHIETLAALEELGLPVVKILAEAKNFSELLKTKDDFERSRFSLPYETDGIVVKVNQLEKREKIGFTNKSPRWAFAFKYAPKRAVTKLESVSFQVGRTGVITPVANLYPVEISGTLVKRATLHNFEEIERLGLKISDTVEIEKSGEIIPKVIRVLKENRIGTEEDIKRPVHCPSCNEMLVKYEDEVAIRCINKNCPEQIELSLIHFASKGAMNIENMGPSIIGRLIEKGLVKSISDIFNLKKDDLLTIDRIKSKSAENLINAIEISKRQSLSRFIYSLGIRNIGEYGSMLLAEKYHNIDNFMNAKYDDLLTVKNIGDESAKAIVLFFSNESNVLEVRKIINSGLVFNSNKISNSLSGASFVITGTLKGFTRDEAREFIISNGGTVQNDVSNNTMYLLVGEEPGSKKAKAEKLSVKIINEDELKEMAGAK